MQLITILGPTATGKTSIAAHLAQAVGGEIISGDSRQLYRRMDLGTGKDIDDYTINGVTVPYHLIDIAEPGTKYNIYQYQQDFMAAYNDIISRGKQPILCGGSGLYVESIVRGYNLSPVPQNDELRSSLEGKSLEELTSILTKLKQENNSVMHNSTDVDSAQRAIRAIEIEEYNKLHATERRPFPAIPSTVIGVSIDRDLRREKITRRLHQRLKDGMVEEVQGLLNEGIAPEDLIYYGLEYKYLTEYCIGKLSYDEMVRQLEIAIHQFAKRQMTWFRGMERRGVKIHWIDATLPMEEKVKSIIMVHNQ